MQNDFNQKISNAAKWSSITEIAAKLSAPISNMLLARILTPDDFGIVATVTMVVSFAEVVTDAGFPKYIVQHEFADKEQLDEYTSVAFWTNILLSFIIWGGMSCISEKLAILVGSPGCGMAIIVTGIDIPILAFSGIQIARFRREFDFKSLFVVRIVTSLVPILVTVPLALMFHSYWAMILGFIVRDILNACMLLKLSTWKPNAYFSFTKFKKMFSFTVWTVVENITGWLTGYVGTFIVGNKLNIHFLGYYKTTMNTVNSYMGIITSSVLPVLFSSLSRYQDNNLEFERIFLKFQRMIALLVFPLGIGIFVYRRLVTTILLGEKWIETADFLGMWAMISAICIVLGQLNSEIYRSKGKPKLSVLQQLLQLAVLIPTLMWGVQQSYEVLTTSRALIRLEAIVVSAMITQLGFGIRFSEVLKNIWCPLFASVIMALAAYFLRTAFDSILWELFTVFLCALIYAGVLLLLPSGRRLLAEIPVLQKLLHLKENPS